MSSLPTEDNQRKLDLWSTNAANPSPCSWSGAEIVLGLWALQVSACSLCTFTGGGPILRKQKRHKNGSPAIGNVDISCSTDYSFFKKIKVVGKKTHKKNKHFQWCSLKTKNNLGSWMALLWLFLFILFFPTVDWTLFSAFSFLGREDIALSQHWFGTMPKAHQCFIVIVFLRFLKLKLFILGMIMWL